MSGKYTWIKLNNRHVTCYIITGNYSEIKENKLNNKNPFILHSGNNHTI